jgi:hypothetical protein
LQQENQMAFIIAFVLAAFTGILYYNGPGFPLATICSNTLDLCQHPAWPFAAAIAFCLGGLVFRANQL